MSKPLKTFISYSHEDEDHKDELMRHMVNLIIEEKYLIWEDRKISPGSKWEAELTKRLKESNVVLLLVSANFLASEYCRGKELQIALEKAKKDQTRIIPIILSDCDWTAEGIGLRDYQALPRDGKAIDNINNWGSSSEAMKMVIDELRNLAEELNQGSQVRSFTELDVLALPPPDNEEAIDEAHKYNCDRKDQKADFNEHLLDYEDAGFYFSFVCGNKDEQVDSFLKRIEIEELTGRWGDVIHNINVTEKNAITFTFQRKLEHSKKMFRRNLIRNIHMQADESLPDEFTFEEVARLSAFNSISTLAITIKVYSSDWLKAENHGEDFVKWLFEEFFKSSILNGCNFKVITFLSIVFNHGVDDNANKKKDAIKAQIEKGVRALRQSELSEYIESSFCKISELPSVPAEDLEEWFSLLYTNPLDVKEVMSRVFEEEKPERSMAEIEQKTHPIVEEFLNRKHGI